VKIRTIPADKIVEVVRDMSISMCVELPDDVLDAIKKAREIEQSPMGIEVLDQLIENAQLARRQRLPLCQDTGLAVAFVEIGGNVHIEGDLIEAINEGVRQGYNDGYLRKSACDCLSRKNTGDNTPAVVHTEIVPGDKLVIRLAAKGGGSENMSRVTVLKPSQGIAGIKEFIRVRILESGGNPCPPLVVGVGIGGTFERTAYLAKKALLRPLGQFSADPEIKDLEIALLEEINNTGVGPMGYGGRVTALAVHVLAQPCHIASLPVAININCHSHRHREIEL